MEVIKRDGQKEDFDWGKLRKSILAAGASEEEVESIVQEVETWLPMVANNNLVSYQAIWTKVVESLKQINPVAAKSYQEYQKNQ